jgi:hypothetical protein
VPVVAGFVRRKGVQGLAAGGSPKETLAIFGLTSNGKGSCRSWLIVHVTPEYPTVSVSDLTRLDSLPLIPGSFPFD